ncbi:hypothetical protein DSO57_1039512, partial [Entomophthora muscae]
LTGITIWAITLGLILRGLYSRKTWAARPLALRAAAPGRSGLGVETHHWAWASRGGKLSILTPSPSPPKDPSFRSFLPK